MAQAINPGANNVKILKNRMGFSLKAEHVG